jgi:dihydroorotate dehydrogenase electron transfer subunit
MAKLKMTATVSEQRQISAEIFDMKIKAPEIAGEAVPGQFVSLYSKDGSRLLPRPISLCGIDREKGELRLVYRTAGAGTKEFSGLQAGDTIDVLGPLGNGFPLGKGKKAFLIGGGIGIPPMLELAKALSGENEVQAVLGYRSNSLFLKEEFEAYGSVYVATEDGSAGTKGNVLDAIRENALDAQVIYACGPTPMLRALKAYAAEKNMECWLSLEEKMACGVGACLACVCQSKEVDSHSQVHNKRICKDGPVFAAEEIEL